MGAHAALLGKVVERWLVAPVLGARTNSQLIAALASEELELPEEILIALDDVSAPALGYPEAGWAQRR